MQEKLGGGLIESVDVNLRGVLGWGREAMSMCRRSQESACAADRSHLAENRCLWDAGSQAFRVVRHLHRESLL